MRPFNKLILCAVFMVSIQTASAGVSLGATRVIYNEKDKETALEVKNAPDEGTAEKAYLIQSWVSNFDETNKSKAPFVFTPPLFKLESGKSNRLRLTATDLTSLPTDRESIYLVNVRAIPGTQKNSASNALEISFQNIIKLIYRPASLTKEKAAVAYRELKVSRLGNDIVLKNSTPYYISIGSLTSGDTTIDKSITVPPAANGKDGEVRIESKTRGTITWNAINDSGGMTSLMSTAG